MLTFRDTSFSKATKICDYSNKEQLKAVFFCFHNGITPVTSTCFCIKGSYTLIPLGMITQQRHYEQDIDD